MRAKAKRNGKLTVKQMRAMVEEARNYQRALSRIAFEKADSRKRRYELAKLRQAVHEAAEKLADLEFCLCQTVPADVRMKLAAAQEALHDVTDRDLWYELWR